MRYYTALLLLCCCLLSDGLRAQKMIGFVTDLANSQPMPNISYENIFTHITGVTDSNGRFAMNVEKGQLIEFRKLGYNVVRVRIPSGALPPFFRIAMEQGAVQLDEVEVRNSHRDYRSDSMRYHDLYKRELEYQKMSTMDMIQHPFTALSKHYRQIMSFQKEYTYLDQQKYVDYAFNEKLVTNLTGLKGDSLQNYMRRFRPSYEQLRALPEYYFFSYVKQSVEIWRRQQRGSNSRSSY